MNDGCLLHTSMQFHLTSLLLLLCTSLDAALFLIHISSRFVIDTEIENRVAEHAISDILKSSDDFCMLIFFLSLCIACLFIFKCRILRSWFSNCLWKFFFVHYFSAQPLELLNHKKIVCFPWQKNSEKKKLNESTNSMQLIFLWV